MCGTSALLIQGRVRERVRPNREPGHRAGLRCSRRSWSALHGPAGKPAKSLALIVVRTPPLGVPPPHHAAAALTADAVGDPEAALEETEPERQQRTTDLGGFVLCCKHRPSAPIPLASFDARG